MRGREGRVPEKEGEDEIAVAVNVEEKSKFEG